MRRMPSWSQKIEARYFLRVFELGIFYDGVSRYAATPLIVALSPGRSDITRFCPWSPIATGYIYIYIYTHTHTYTLGTAVAQLLRCCATNRRVAGSIPDGVTGIFHWHKILPIALWPWGRLSLLQKWVPVVFPGGEGGPCVRLTALSPSCAVVMKSGNLNSLEPRRPLQACKGTDFFILICTVSVADIIGAQNSFGSVNTDLYCFLTDGFRNARLLQIHATFTADISFF